jgi:hypothetical protein
MKTPDYLLEPKTDQARSLGYAIVDRLLAYQKLAHVRGGHRENGRGPEAERPESDAGFG